MSPRVTSPLLLVGSLPAESTDAALRAGADLFGDLVFALPDGETGARAAWVSYERNGSPGQTPTSWWCRRPNRRPAAPAMPTRRRCSGSARG